MIDILYVAWERLEFTQFSFGCLLQNTDWSLVDRLVVHDDDSSEQAQAWLQEKAEECPVKTVMTVSRRRSPVAVMNAYLRDEPNEWFCKIDNDIPTPPGWLQEMVGVVERHPELDCLGMEAGRMGVPGDAGIDREGPRSYQECSHIGGVGLIRSAAIEKRIPEYGRFGWTEYQHRYDPVRGWIAPDLLVPQLDRIPIEPWCSLSDHYIERGWQRPWPRMDARWCSAYWAWFPTTEEAAA